MLPLLLVALTATDTYSARLEALGATRGRLARAHATSRGAARAAVLEEARSAVISTLRDDVFPAWHGTPWTFSGTSSRPGSGSIACGFFVGTVLAHAGFVVDRIALGRLASEHIALSLTEDANLARYSDRPAAEVAAATVARGPGLYLLGLDHHAALILVDERGATLVHSTYYGEPIVKSEPLLGDNPFDFSRYRVVAKLLDDRMMRRWLAGERFEARSSSGRRGRRGSSGR